jgi:uncharacterized repeat protein (TIGR03803 family)
MFSHLKFSSAFKAAVALFTLVLATAAWADKLTVLHAFNGTAGGTNPTTLVMDSSGNLYGVLTGGGNSACLQLRGCGAIFELTKNPDGSWTKTVIYRFKGRADGASPTGIIMDASGNIFGIAQAGGNTACFEGCGVIFKLTQSGGVWTETPIFTFLGDLNNLNGHNPIGNLVMDSAGNLYGGAGSDFFGEIFEVSPQSDGTWTGTIIYRFKTLQEGEIPIGPFVFDGTGNLYGVTKSGGEICCGTVFELSPASGGSWTLTKLQDFGSIPDGSQPAGGLIIDGGGNLYGTTAYGGLHPKPGAGTIFELSRSSGTWTKTILVDFSGGNGRSPSGTLLMDASGDLYGTTEFGGLGFAGTAFKASPGSGAGWNLSVLYFFKNARDGGSPEGNLVMDASGNLYGAGFTGGGPTGSGKHNTGNGVVFQLTPPAN